jgi:hypothetical protein
MQQEPKMIVRDIMTRDIEYVTPNETIEQAAA